MEIFVFKNTFIRLYQISKRFMKILLRITTSLNEFGEIIFDV